MRTEAEIRDMLRLVGNFRDADQFNEYFEGQEDILVWLLGGPAAAKEFSPNT